MHDLTLRQIEVIRAVMLTGTISGAAGLLNVSAPGISRLVKHAEETLGIRLFERKAGVFIPSVEASRVFDQVREVYRQVESLNAAVSSLKCGEDVRLSFATAPSIAQFIAARVLQNVRGMYGDLFVDMNVLKIEETVDYLLLERGEFVIMSSPVENAAIDNEEIAEGRLVAIMPEGHRLSKNKSISALDLAKEPVIGVDPNDPYGALLAKPFLQAGIEINHAMRGRFAQTVVSLVRHGLGVAVIDEFSVAEVYMPGLVRRPLVPDVPIKSYVARKKGRVLSRFAEDTIGHFQRQLERAVKDGPWYRSSK
ncbi:LysR family transcriptional regulator [Rhodobacterales bacterium LSUCC0387]|nr:LysR family transcriptional regulator [Rhodobacterales bacterium LSUCC0387]